MCCFSWNFLAALPNTTIYLHWMEQQSARERWMTYRFLECMVNVTGCIWNFPSRRLSTALVTLILLLFDYRPSIVAMRQKVLINLVGWTCSGLERLLQSHRPKECVWAAASPRFSCWLVCFGYFFAFFILFLAPSLWRVYFRFLLLASLRELLVWRKLLS